MAIKFYDYQIDAINRCKNGSILCGGVGSGKSVTSIGYFIKCMGGKLPDIGGDSLEFEPLDDIEICDLYIITTARKRDTAEWEGDLSKFLMSTKESINLYSNKIVVDSWNNIAKYVDVKNAFFIFDEQRVVGKGAWVKSFLKITKSNQWILLSATPGDTWSDYIPVFLANGFYKNRTEFNREHVVFSSYCNFPKIDRYLNTKRLIRLRDSVLVNMDYERPTQLHHVDIPCEYDILKYKDLMKNRWNYEKDAPIENASELCYELRKITNGDSSRIIATESLIRKAKRAIIFYNFDYELDILKSLCDANGFIYAEWNGHKHQPIPDTPEWVYLVQYNAGAEGWNCIKTDSIIFYSQNYSYKVLIQSCGRIDRLNTPYKDLYYYHLKSKSSMDIAIAKAIANKKKFNETKFVTF